MGRTFKINKGVNAPMEFQGLKAQYILYMGLLLLSMLFALVLMYLVGLNFILSLILIGAPGAFGAWKIMEMNKTYGENGLMKLSARKRLPRVIRFRDRVFVKRLKTLNKLNHVQ
ncbi:hypothetical protein A33Q_0907 [Indibacter alkaliphilus LW1]|uniref:DUF4133 domain-containing protein n=1 Tax=Indibacter alkaliphilus (strain CCUG 57479 / KCTC 22604 / LW1) TaxID=1189612 RepID=S2DIQ2_INDAL|nr:DUF4133 domain-containing protein [Indibacter alkaliphilus]EOZ98924.1 hypothetical protein A33Q_0907 [Indibacter alkaliphilus LW1]